MIVTYSPDGQEQKRWVFDPRKLRESRIEMIERRMGKLTGEPKGVPYDQFLLELNQGSASARRVLLWHLLSLEHPTIQIQDVDPRRDELTIQQSKRELTEWRDAFETVASAGMDPAQREVMLAELDRRIAEAPDDDEGSGKAPPPTSSEGTGSPSSKSSISRRGSSKRTSTTGS